MSIADHCPPIDPMAVTPNSKGGFSRCDLHRNAMIFASRWTIFSSALGPQSAP